MEKSYTQYHKNVNIFSAYMTSIKGGLVALMLLVLAVVLWLVLAGRPPLVVDVGKPDDSAYLVSFLMPEADQQTSYRWSSAGAGLWLPGTATSAARLSLRLHGEHLVEQGAPGVRLRNSSRTIARFDVDARWRQYHLLVPPLQGSAIEPLTAVAPLVIESVVVSPGPEDPRLLGVVLADFELVPLQVGWVDWSVVALVWGLALLAGSVWWLPLSGWLSWWSDKRLWVVVLVVVSVGALLVGAAWYMPYQLLRIFPASLWLWLPGTAAVLALRARRYGLTMWCGVLGLALYARVGLIGQLTYPGDNDAVFYYTLAENLAAGRGLRLDYIWNYLSQPSGLPHLAHDYWLPLTAVWMSAALRLGESSLAMALLPGLFCLVGLSLLTYAVGWRLTDSNWTAWGAACLLLLVAPLVAATLTPETIIYYALFVAASLLCMLYGRTDWRWFGLAGVCAGLAHLTRQDAVLLVPVLLLAVALGQDRGPGRWWVLALALGGYLVVLTPMLLLNLWTFGAPLPPGLSQALFFTHYEDLYAYGRSFSLQTYLEAVQADGTALAAARLEALVALAGTLGAILPVVLWVLVVVRLVSWARAVSEGWWLLVAPLGYLVLLLSFYTLVATFPGFYSIPRSLPALLPFLLVLAVDGLRYVAREQRWLATIVLVAAGGVSFGQGLGMAQQQIAHYREWGQELTRVGELLKADEEEAAQASRLPAAQASRLPVVMTRYPWGLYYATGYPAVQIPYEDRATILTAARRYGARYLLLTEDVRWQRPALAEVYTDVGSDRRFEFVGVVPGTQIKLFRLDRSEAGRDAEQNGRE